MIARNEHSSLLLDSEDFDGAKFSLKWAWASWCQAFYPSKQSSEYHTYKGKKLGLN
jgi:hypothetical protein